MRPLWLAGLLLSSCARTAAPPPLASAGPVSSAPPPEYVLRAGDQVSIGILEEAGSTRVVPVRPDGRVSYDYVGEVQASGRTIDQVRHDIEERLAELYVLPHVSVIGLTFQARVYILGEVTVQRSVPFHEGMTLVAALAEVGGLTPKARHNQLLVVRGGLERPSVAKADFRRIVRGEAPDVRLQAGDIVYASPTPLTTLERVSVQILPFFQNVINIEAAEEAARNLGHHNTPPVILPGR